MSHDNLTVATWLKDNPHYCSLPTDEAALRTRITLTLRAGILLGRQLQLAEDTEKLAKHVADMARETLLEV